MYLQNAWEDVSRWSNQGWSKPKKRRYTDLPCEPDEDRACASVIVPRLLHLGSDITPDGGEISLTAHTIGRMEYQGTRALDE